MNDLELNEMLTTLFEDLEDIERDCAEYAGMIMRRVEGVRKPSERHMETLEAVLDRKRTEIFNKGVFYAKKLAKLGMADDKAKEWYLRKIDQYISNYVNAISEFYNDFKAMEFDRLRKKKLEEAGIIEKDFTWD